MEFFDLDDLCIYDEKSNTWARLHMRQHCDMLVLQILQNAKGLTTFCGEDTEFDGLQKHFSSIQKLPVMWKQML